MFVINIVNVCKLFAINIVYACICWQTKPMHVYACHVLLYPLLVRGNFLEMHMFVCYLAILRSGTQTIYVLIAHILSVEVWMHFYVYIFVVCVEWHACFGCCYGMNTYIYVAIVICYLSWIRPLVCHFHFFE